MKAVKINKIVWNLNDLSPAEREKVKKSLPTSKGFMAEDDFNVPDKVPDLLAKKFGYDIINFSYSEINIIENFEDLLKSFTPKGEKPKKLFSIKGELSEFGEYCFGRLLNAISRRRELEAEGTPEDEMPKLLDKVMLSLEAITGLDWDATSDDEYKVKLDDILKEKIAKYIKAVETKKRIKKEVKKELKSEEKDIEDEDELDDFDDDDRDDDEE